MAEQTKKCPKCGEWKPLSDYGKDKSRKDGRGIYCKGCRRELWREYYTKYREASKDYNQKYYREHREEEGRRCQKYNARVKRPSCPSVGGRGAKFEVFTCEVCGREFRRLKSAVDWNYEHRGHLPRFCSPVCRAASQRKGYKSPYARKIEEIQKGVRA